MLWSWVMEVQEDDSSYSPLVWADDWVWAKWSDGERPVSAKDLLIEALEKWLDEN